MNGTNLKMFKNNKSTLYCAKFVVLLVLQVSAIVISLLIIAFFYKHRPIQRHMLILNEYFLRVR
jgi:hypothetical protein